jgi:hypothetical protein
LYRWRQCDKCNRYACHYCVVKIECAEGEMCSHRFCSQECRDKSDVKERYAIDGKLLDCSGCHRWRELTKTKKQAKKQKV